MSLHIGAEVELNTRWLSGQGLPPRHGEALLGLLGVAVGLPLGWLAARANLDVVSATISLHWGDENSLLNRAVACDFAGGMLSRGTRQRSRAAFKDALDRLNATVSVGGSGASIDVRRENLLPALRLVAEALREPAFAAEEFEELKRAALTGAEAQRSDP